MSVINFKDLKNHIGHDIVCVGYALTDEHGKRTGKYQSITLECENCNEVLLSFDRDEEPEEETAIIVEFIGESGYWEWYSFRKNVTPKQAIKDYIKDNDLEKTSKLTEELDKNLSREGNVVYAKDYDVRAYEVIIS